MRFADKLVLKRQRHLKWRAFDVLELALMVLCGVSALFTSRFASMRRRPWPPPTWPPPPTLRD